MNTFYANVLLLPAFFKPLPGSSSSGSLRMVGVRWPFGLAPIKGHGTGSLSRGRPWPFGVEKLRW